MRPFSPEQAAVGHGADFPKVLMQDRSQFRATEFRARITTRTTEASELDNALAALYDREDG